jgi:hypothetical protein
MTPLEEDDPWPRRDGIVEALQRSRDGLQEALNLAEKEPKLSATNIDAIQQAVVKANEVYSSISWNMVAIEFTEGTRRSIKAPRPLSFKKTAAT